MIFNKRFNVLQYLEILLLVYDTLHDNVLGETVINGDQWCWTWIFGFLKLEK